MKDNKSFSRIINAAGYSLAGIKAALRNEAAFRQEVAVLIILIPIIFFLTKTGLERALLIFCVLMVIIVELLNSAIETIADRIGTEHHPLTGRAKDLGSAAVFTSILTAIIVWVLILI
ncbi:MAG: diacylglycerol kinase [Desulfobacula sp.]|nr:diacylglycerol kinase [Desulfobacula sp.]